MDRSYFKISFDVIVPDLWTVQDMKLALAHWCQEYDIKIEGLVKQVESLKQVDNDYFYVD